MGRGGARTGAGRKPALDWYEQLWIGGTCERMWNDERAAAKVKALAEFNGRTELPALYAGPRGVPLNRRATYLTSNRFERHVSDVEEERRTLARMSNEDTAEPPRLFQVRVPRPMGKRLPVIATVAALASERFEKPVTGRTVRECWERMRAALNSG